MPSRKVILLSFIATFVVLLIIVVLNDTSDDASNNGVTTSLEGFVIEIEPIVALPVTIVQNNNVVDTINSQKKEIDESMSGEISLFSDGFLEEKVTIGNPGEVKIVSLSVDENSAENKIIESLTDSRGFNFFIEEGRWINKAKFYSNNSWLTGLITTTSTSTDGEFVIMNKVNNEWVLLYAGTGPSTDDFLDIGAPEELIRGYYEIIEQ